MFILYYLLATRGRMLPARRDTSAAGGGGSASGTYLSPFGTPIGAI